MFVGFHKTIAKFGGFRLGVGTRMSKKNSTWMFLAIMFIALFKAMFYMMLLCGWLVYAMCYGIYLCIKKIVSACKAKQQE